MWVMVKLSNMKLFLWALPKEKQQLCAAKHQFLKLYVLLLAQTNIKVIIQVVWAMVLLIMNSEKADTNTLKQLQHLD